MRLLFLLIISSSWLFSCFFEEQTEKQKKEPSFQEEQTKKQEKEPSFQEELTKKQEKEPSFQEELTKKQEKEPSFQEELTKKQEKEPSFQEELTKKQEKEPSFQEELTKKQEKEPSFQEELTKKQEKEPSLQADIFSNKFLEYYHIQKDLNRITVKKYSDIINHHKSWFSKNCHDAELEKMSNWLSCFTGEIKTANNIDKFKNKDKEFIKAAKTKCGPQLRSKEFQEKNLSGTCKPMEFYNFYSEKELIDAYSAYLKLFPNSSEQKFNDAINDLKNNKIIDCTDIDMDKLANMLRCRHNILKVDNNIDKLNNDLNFSNTLSKECGSAWDKTWRNEKLSKKCARAFGG
jgi:hypothetical protein